MNYFRNILRDLYLGMRSRGDIGDAALSGTQRYRGQGLGHSGTDGGY